MGFRVLRNAHVTIARGAARLLIGASSISPRECPTPTRVASGPRDRRRRAAGLPSAPGAQSEIAPLAEQAGFDLQLSDTRTPASSSVDVRDSLGPRAHAAGLSRRGRLWVYVSAGTGTWGPPVRLGTRPELTLLRLVAANVPNRR